MIGIYFRKFSAATAYMVGLFVLFWVAAGFIVFSPVYDWWRARRRRRPVRRHRRFWLVARRMGLTK